jgi:hypothetical protein
LDDAKCKIATKNVVLVVLTHFFPGDEVTTTHFGWGPFLAQNFQLTKPMNLKPFQT